MVNHTRITGILLSALLIFGSCKEDKDPQPSPAVNPPVVTDPVKGCVISESTNLIGGQTYKLALLYDGQRRLERLNYLNAAGALQGYMLYKRLPSGNLTLLERYDAAGRKNMYIEYSNYQNNLPGIYKVYYPDNGNWAQVKQERFEYNAAGQVTKVITYDQAGPNWVDSDYYLIEYDAQGNPYKSSQYTKAGNGQPDQLVGTLLNTYETQVNPLYKFEPLMLDVMDGPEKFFTLHSKNVLKSMTFNNYGPIMGNQIRNYTNTFNAEGKLTKVVATGAYDPAEDTYAYDCK